MSRIRALSLLPALLIALSSGGCAILAIGAIAAGAAYGTIKYTENEALRDFEADFAATWDAARAQLKDMGYAVMDEVTAGPRSGTIESGDADVEVEKVSDEYTRVTARFGTFETAEHKAKARRLLDGIADRLGE